jgi:hypothetical protein
MEEQKQGIHCRTGKKMNFPFHSWKKLNRDQSIDLILQWTKNDIVEVLQVFE